MEAILTGVLLIFNIVFALGMFFYAKRELEKQATSKFNDIIGRAKEELMPWFLGEGLPSAVEFLNSDSGQEFAESLMDPIVTGLQKRIYGSIGGLASGETRQMKQLEKAAAEDLISGSHPLAATILDKLPSVKKLLKENPSLLALLPQVAKKYQGFIPQALPALTGNGNVTQEIRGL